MNIENILKESNQKLNKVVKNANLDSELLLSKTIKKSREYIMLNPKRNLEIKYVNIFNNLVKKRKKGEPVAYLINKKEFWKDHLFVYQPQEQE